MQQLANAMLLPNGVDVGNFVVGKAGKVLVNLSKDNEKRISLRQEAKQFPTWIRHIWEKMLPVKSDRQQLRP